MWSPIYDEIFEESTDYNEFHFNYDDSVAVGVANYLSTVENVDIVFIDFDHPDSAGHSYGFTPDIPEYVDAIENVDTYIGLIITALEGRDNYDHEEWLIIITSDHGGNINGHGGQSIEERIIPIILSGNMIDNTNIPDQTYIVDIVPTIVQFLGHDIECGWNLDGKSIGLNVNEYPVPDLCPTCPYPLK
eukprot:UN27763